MNEQVLIIDDEQDAVDDICFQLRHHQITCRGHTDPKAAIDSFRVSPTDVVIVDYVYRRYPDLTGVDLIAELQEIKPFTQFVLISGWIDLDEQTLSADLASILKADRYIPKPLDLHRLVDTVRDALQTIHTQSRDWEAIAQQYVSKGTVTPEHVQTLNETIKSHVVRAVDEGREESE